MFSDQSLKRAFWVLINLFLIGAVASMFFVIIPVLSKYSNTIMPTRTINANATGKATVVPDIATVNFSMIDTGKDPKVLTDNNAKKMQDVVNAVKSLGIEAKDIQTSGYQLNPNYNYQSGRQELVSYTLSQNVTVKMRDLSKVAQLMGQLTPMGINQIGGVTFGVEDPDKFTNTARDEAFRKAKEKAEEMAKAAGARLGKVVAINESTGGGIPPMPYYAKEGMAMGGDARLQANPAIEAGSQDVTVSVNVTYELR
jgi:uncharacterized protein